MSEFTDKLKEDIKAEEQTLLSKTVSLKVVGIAIVVAFVLGLLVHLL